MEFKDKLKTLMEDSNISGKKLSKLTGISRSSICLYLSGERKPKQDAVEKIANCLRVTPTYLLGYEENEFEHLPTRKYTIEDLFLDITRQEKKEDIKKLTKYLEAYINE